MSTDQAIRERLAVLDEIDIQYEHDRASRAIDALRDALLAVVDLHHPRDPTPVEEVGIPGFKRGEKVCTVCAAGAGALGQREVHPCATVRAIMGKIGARP